MASGAIATHYGNDVDEIPDEREAETSYEDEEE
jgi:hypothetical protein